MAAEAMVWDSLLHGAVHVLRDLCGEAGGVSAELFRPLLRKCLEVCPQAPHVPGLLGSHLRPRQRSLNRYIHITLVPNPETPKQLNWQNPVISTFDNHEEGACHVSVRRKCL